MLLRFLQGLFFALLGGVGLLYLYGFSSLVDPTLEGWDRQRAILEKLLPPHTESVPTLLCLVLFGSGCYLMLTAVLPQLRPSRARP